MNVLSSSFIFSGDTKGDSNTHIGEGINCVTVKAICNEIVQGKLSID